MKIDFKEIAKKWQKKWEEKRIFESNISKKKKFFITFPYPYCNGGPHIGHTFSFSRCDAFARFKRMQGFNVLFPQGFHATGEPIVGAIKRLRENDEEQIYAFKIYGISNEQIEEFKEKDPEFLARFWMKWWIEDLKNFGYSADWRRTFITALTSQYNRFIEWQYNTLRKKGFVVQGTHPIIWCPNCKSPTGDHDRLRGEGESPIEYTILKFRLEDKVIPCGTLRPETIFGVTNIWINPEVEYKWCKVDNEIWLLSENAVKKLKDQLKKVKVLGKIKGKELVGEYVENPVLKNKILILPAKFVDVDSATGIVMSVPSHAPYDWIALKDLKENINELEKFGISEKELEKIQPISIIKIKDYGENPAIEICNKMKIRNQEDKEKLEIATNEIYKKEFHTGILKDNCGKYSGKKVSEVKEEIIDDFVKAKIADKIWEVTGEVICRCKTKCHVKILENQWFLKFSDEGWKKKVKECVEKMKFYPEEVKQQFLNTVDWLRDKACVRKSGLGTRLPWDREWIIETLSDSVIYMAFYTIWKIIKENDIPAEKLKDEVFDYIFLGEGDVEEISKISGLEKEIIEKMKKEFEYFYPVDLRVSGKDLVQNHLTFYLFHHVAIWPERFWPRAVAVNGFVNVEGKKMSKRFGNIITLRELINKFGPDLVRINIISSSEDMDDADWREENIDPFRERIEWIGELIENMKNAKRKSKLNVDNFLLSRIQKCIKKVGGYYEKLKFRSVTQLAFFDFINNLRWYIKRCGGMENCNEEILRYSLLTWVKLMSPIIPHICEEFWEKLGNDNFVSLEKWPEANEDLIDEESEILEEFLKDVIEDIKEIEKILGKKSKKVHLMIAPNWKFQVYKTFIKNKDKSLKEISELVKVKIDKRKLMEFLQILARKRFELEEKIVERESQFKILEEAKEFIEEEVDAKIFVEDAEKIKVEKAEKAMPNKISIFIE